MKSKVTERALMQRINRVLAKKKQKLKKQRDTSKNINETGQYYILDVEKSMVITTEVDLETLGEKLGALKPYEQKEKEKISKKLVTHDRLLKQYYGLIKEMKKRGVEIPPEVDDIL